MNDSSSNHPARFSMTRSSMTRSFMTLSLLALMATPSASASVSARCAEALPIALDAAQRGAWVPAGSTSCYRADVPQKGLLFVEAAAEKTPWITIESCDPGTLKVREASTRRVMQVEAQSYAICVSAMNPSEDLEKYRLDLLFNPSTEDLAYVTGGGEDERETEIDPNGLTGSGEDERETEIDPNGLTGSGEDERETEIDPNGVRTFTTATISTRCAARQVDDHSDTMTCAETLSTGDTVRAEILNAWGDDTDVFTFDATRRGAIEWKLSSDEDLHMEWLDAEGNRLDSATAGESLTVAVTKGRYYLRVTGQGIAEGAYSLSVESIR